VLRILIAAILFLLSASFAQAANCTVDVSDLDFGPVDSIGNTPTVSSADVSIDCDNITPDTPTITLCGNIGAGGGGTEDGIRQSTAPGGSLGFILYTTGGHSTPWGSAAAPELGEAYRIDVPVGNGSTSASRTIQLHGVVPAGQSTVPIGDYQADFSSSDAVFIYAEGNLDCATLVGEAEATAPFSVTASVAANCLLETANLDFGTTGLIGSNIDADTGIDLTCTAGTDYTITLDGGGAEDPEHRLLTSGSNSVRYDLYSNAQRSAPWGTAPGSTVSGDGDGTLHEYGVYGRIPPQPAAAGAYTDTVVVTITY
jgi:spore coat protein U-like protein